MIVNINHAWLVFEDKPIEERIALANEWEESELRSYRNPRSAWGIRRTAKYLRDGYAGGLHRHAPVGVVRGTNDFIRWFKRRESKTQ
jgi:hypothetical protein